MFNGLIWFCLYFASLSFGDELQMAIDAFTDRMNVTYGMPDRYIWDNTSAEVTTAADDDLNATSRFLAADIPTSNNSTNFTDTTTSTTFSTERSSNDDLETANNISFISSQTLTITTPQGGFENRSSDEPPMEMTKASETLENNNASALLNDRPCRWPLIKKPSQSSEGNPILRWAILILAFALGVAIIVAFLVVALDERPNEANKEEMVPSKEI